MEPKNKKERRKFFLRALALFITGILIVMVPFYFTIRLPQKENKITSNELLVLQEQMNFQKDFFAVRMDSVKRLLDSYNSQKVDIDKLNADIGFLLSEMEQSIATDTTWRAGMYNNIVQTYISLKKSKNSHLKLSTDLSKCKGDLKKAKKPRQTDSLDPL